MGVPLGAVWAYYGHWLNRHIESIGDAVRQAGMKRVYSYILSALGLGGAFIGVATLIKFLIDFLTGGLLTLNDSLRSDLANAVALIVAWLPLVACNVETDAGPGLCAGRCRRARAGDRSCAGLTCTWRCLPG